MMNYTGIHHVSVIVRDLERAKAFYAEVLGLQEIERPPYSLAGAWFAVGGCGHQLHLTVREDISLIEGGIDTRDDHFAIRVESYRDALAWLDRSGVEYQASGRTMAGFPQIFLMDPDRNIVEINAENT